MLSLCSSRARVSLLREAATIKIGKKREKKKGVIELLFCRYVEAGGGKKEEEEKRPIE